MRHKIFRTYTIDKNIITEFDLKAHNKNKSKIVEEMIDNYNKTN